MCTVTYIPNKNGFHLTSNRDENVNRGQAIAPQMYEEDNVRILYPKDADKNGSWIAAKSNGDLVVLLNGAFVKHTVQPGGYRRSRGLILMDIIKADHPAHYYNEMNLGGVEPFTLVLHSDGNLYECRWDGERKRIATLNPKIPYIWSSATLYDKVAAAKRNSWFNDWRKAETSKTTTGIIHFHKHGGEGDLRDGLVIDRDGKMKTVSITNINVKPEGLTMTYEDLKDNKHYVSRLPVEKQVTVKHEPVELPKFFALKSFMIRLFNWEYWSFNTVYTPIMFYWFWLSLKSRAFFFFNTANPLIENGGFLMERKWLIHQLLPKEYTPKTLFFKTGTGIEEIKQTLEEENLSFPIIAKPNIGYRGVMVKKLYNDAELLDYTQNIKVDYLLQAYVNYKNEAGIFYYRMPGMAKGAISAIVGKEFLAVTGDGRSTIMELVTKDPRYFLQLPVLIETHGPSLKTVLANGETQVLVPYGNHARGAKFVDLSHLITDKLTESIDAVSQQIPEFYFGRIDIMYNTWEELTEGKNFSIVELNGAGGEPTHIYDPKHSIFFAWREIIRHWKLLNNISRLNAKNKGLKYMTYREGMTMLKENTAYLKLIS